MNKLLKKWLPAIVVLSILLVTIIISLFNSNIKEFTVEADEKVSEEKIEQILKMLEDDSNKNNAAKELEEAYKDHKKDDTYYLTSAKIIIATENDINASGVLNNVINKTPEYYYLRFIAESGAFFTMGEVPDKLLNSSVEATRKYVDIIDFPLLAGKLYYDKDNYTAALYYLDKALQIDDKNVDANYYYALSIYLLGEKEEGITYMNKAKDLYKGSDQAYKKSMEDYISLMKEDKR